MGNPSPNIDHLPDAGIAILDRKGETPSEGRQIERQPRINLTTVDEELGAVANR
jgi:hypothetical protein